MVVLFRRIISLILINIAIGHLLSYPGPYIFDYIILSVNASKYGISTAIELTSFPLYSSFKGDNSKG